MIPKGNQRGGGQNLATHLMNSFDNEQVEIAEMRGSVAQDLHGAFAEWHAQAKTTNCQKYLYSLSLNPDHRQGSFDRTRYVEFADRTEKKMGLTGQPRVMVFHVKEGREHCHVVWSRIDGEKMKAVQMSHDRQKLRTVAQDFARDHGITLPEGMRRDRGKERFRERSNSTNLAENQQKERTGETKDKRRAAINRAWLESANGPSFIAALEQRGYYLAKGDRRSYVVVDQWGEVHSLSRQINGAKSHHLQARLGMAAEQLPDIKSASVKAREGPVRQEQEKIREQRAADIEQRRARMLAQQEQRRHELAALHKEMKAQHTEEARSLSDLHKAANDHIAELRAANQPKGLKAFLVRITGIQASTERRQQGEDKSRGAEQQRQSEALARRHQREQHEIHRRGQALERIETRERMSFETRLKREDFQRAAQPDQIYKIDPQKERKVVGRQGLSKEVRAAGEKHEPHRPDVKKEDLRGGLRGLFNSFADRIRASDAAKQKAPQQPAKTDLGKEFTGAIERHEPHRPEGLEKDRLRSNLQGKFDIAAAKPRQEEADKANAAEQPVKPLDTLQQDFARRAAQKDAQQDRGPDGPERLL